MNYGEYIRDIPNWPKQGVVFKDITPLLHDPKAFRAAVDDMVAPYRDKGVTKVLGAEARGFIFGAAIALELGAGFIPARKPGKLPHDTVSATYELEYGIDSLEIHADSLEADDVVLIVDDVLATGGTASAKADLVEKFGAQIAGYSFFIELEFLHGRDKLDPSIPVNTIVKVS